MSRHRAAARGFSLVELMIAMALGLLVVGAASAVFLSNQRTYQANEGLSRVQESGRVAFELLAREIRAAGGSACVSFAPEEGVATADQQAFFNGVGIVEGGNALASARDQLTLVSGDDAAFPVSAATATTATLVLPTGTTASDLFEGGDRIVFCTARNTEIVTVSSVAGNTLTFPALSVVPAADEAASVMIARYRSHRWFVAANPREGTSLFFQRAGGDVQEVAEGVLGLNVRHLPAARGCGAATAYADGAPADVRCVNSVQLQMRIRGVDIDGQELTRDLDTVISLRSRNA